MEKIGVIGAGRLGICLALNLERIGYQVLAVDSSSDRIARLKTNSIDSEEPHVQDYLDKAKNLSFYNSSQELVHSKPIIIFLCVPTPSLESETNDCNWLNLFVQSEMIMTSLAPP